MLAIGVGSSS
uniref:Uncharacterized protein n=1 Tax=Anguilla anguilla TaxID=7936 RepID=A0A0E9VNM7_ANGAN